MPTVVSIHRVSEKNGTAAPLQEARFESDQGLEGDWRSRRGRGRQITLIEAEALEVVAGVLGRAEIVPGASRRQVVVRGVRLNDLVGKTLRVGPLLVHIDELCEPCDNMERMVGPGARPAMVGRGGVCGRVLEGGILRPGDPVTVESRA